MNYNIRKYVLPNLPYLLIFWFCDLLGEAYRLAPGADMAVKTVNVIVGLGSMLASPLPSFYPPDLLIGLLGAATIRAAVYIKGRDSKKFRKNVEYGSARWGKPRDIKPYKDPVFSKNVILTQTESLTMSSRPKNPKYARNKNVLVVGGSGSGKTRFFVKPNLMQCHSSYVVTDPNGQRRRVVDNNIFSRESLHCICYTGTFGSFCPFFQLYSLRT